LQQYLPCNQHRALHYLPDHPRSSSRAERRPGADAPTGQLRNPMNTMAPIRPVELHACRVHLTTGVAAAAEARSQVGAANCGRDPAGGPVIAVMLTSELVAAIPPT
jgi:hypothetical protein